MKRIVCLGLTLLLILGMAACGGQSAGGQESGGASGGNAAGGDALSKKEQQVTEGLGWGAVVSFGSYEQDNDPANGKEPIEWLVLDVQEDQGRALLLSRQILDAKLFNDSEEVAFWDESTLRAWLNDGFLNEAFSEREREAVQLSHMENPGNSVYDTKLVPATEDRVFLLSLDEVEQYFLLAWGSTAHFYDNDIKAQPTAYALSKGLETENQRADWCLRSSGMYAANSCANVHASGWITAVGSLDIEERLWGIRPAVWVDLDADLTLLRRQSSDPDIGLSELLPTDWAGRYVVKEEEHTDPDCSVVHVYCKMAYESGETDRSRLFSVYYLPDDSITLPESTSLGTYNNNPVEIVVPTDVHTFSSDAVTAEYTDLIWDTTFIVDALEDRVAELEHFRQEEQFGYDRRLYFPPSDVNFAAGVYQLDCGSWSEKSKRELLGENDYTSYLSVAPDGSAYLKLGSHTPLKCEVRVAKEPDQLPEGEPYCIIRFEESGAVKPAYYTQMVLSIHNMERAEMADDAPEGLDGSVWTYTWVSSEYWTDEFWLGGIG